MTGYVAVHLPGFRLERCGYAPDEPVVLLAHQRGAERVQACTAPVAREGVRPGMTLAEARSVVPGVRAERLDPAGERQDLDALVAALARFSPNARAVPPEGAVVEVGAHRLDEVRATLARFGHPCRLVWAPEPRAAMVLARALERDRVVPQVELARALGPVPIEGLGLPEAVRDTLVEVGIRTVGAFAALPRAALVGRYGAEVVGLHALARGEAPPERWPLPPPRPETTFAVDFPEPVEQVDALLFVLNGLLRDLAATLDATGRAATRVQCVLRLEEGEHRVPVRLGVAMRGPERLLRLLRARLERVRLASPVVGVMVELLEGVAFSPTPLTLGDGPHATESLGELVARLQDALGEEAVVRPSLAERHRPEAAWVARPVGAAPLPSAPQANKADPAQVHEPVDPARPRPALLLPEPASLRVAVGPSGRPRAVVLGRDWQPVKAEGPERLVGEWWGPAAFARDYWRLQLPDGRRAWVFRAAEPDGGEVGSGRWFLHGWFDGPARPPALPEEGGVRRLRPAPPPYTELVCRSNYSFCEGASHPAELVERARARGLAGLALTDRDGLYGAVQAHRAAKVAGIPLLHGALLTVRLGSGSLRQRLSPEAGPRLPGAEVEGASVVALVRDRAGWSTLCRLLTTARMEGGTIEDYGPLGPVGDPAAASPYGAPVEEVPAGSRPGREGRPEKGWAELPFERLLERNDGLILLARGPWPEAALARLREAAGDRLYRAVSRRLAPDEEAVIDALAAGPIPAVATGDVLLHDPSRQRLQDVLTCIRLGLTLEQAGRRLQPNAERVLMGPEAMAARFARWPELLARTEEIRSRCAFSLDEIRYRYPREVVPEGYTPIQWLRELCRRGIHRRYGGRVPEALGRQIEHELGIIERLDFAAYFLTVEDLVRFARDRGILCQGRGSAANSAVCFVLGITAVDPSQSSLLFERFISEERGEPPDIDVDFEHERREEVIQYVYRKYGRERAAMVNEVIAWRGRMAVRDVGRALGYGPDQVDRLAQGMDGWGRGSLTDERVREAGLEPGDPTLRELADLVRQIQGFPRHVSIHVGGFVMSDDPLIDAAPLEPARMDGRTVLQWDKNDVDDLGFVKVDLLSLGMLTAIRKAFDLVRRHHGVDLDLSTVPREDPAVYDMLGAADSIGVFQVESRAQQSMLPRLKPRCFYDLVVETAIVRPGPIQGGMVHPYLDRRSGAQPVTYVDPRLRPILERTLGVPIFQEQVMAMAVAVGGFTPGEADALRRAMGAWRKRGGLEPIIDRLMAGMEKNGIPPAFREQICQQIQGFAEYGFPESHAASFAHLVYVSAWLRCHFLAAFTAALINAQPMGFYAPRTLVADAQRHGVEVREVDVARSEWDCTLEPAADGVALRLGLRLVAGLREQDARTLVAARSERPFASLPDLAGRTGLGPGVLRLLARADALRSLGYAEPRLAQWAVEGLWPGLFARLARPADAVTPPAATPAERVQADFAATGLSVHRHPVGLVRERLGREGYTPLARLVDLPTGRTVRVAGLVSHRQRPDTASGVVFMTLEDETGSANVVVWPKVYERQRRVARGERLVRVLGRLERQGEVLNLIAFRFQRLEIAPPVAASSRDFR